MALLLRQGLVITLDRHHRLIESGTVIVEGRTIVEVSEKTYSGKPTDVVLDCRGKAILPGLVNAHAHTTEVLFRGCATDLPFLEWLFERNHPLLEHMSEDDAYAAGLLCALELLCSGTTCYLDPEVWPGHFDAVARAIARTGLRSCLALALEGSAGYNAHSPIRPFSHAIMQSSGLHYQSPALARARSWHGAADGRLRVWLGPRVLSAVDPALARLLVQTAAEWQTGITVHFAEVPQDVAQIYEQHGMLPTTYLERVGLMGPHLVLVHGICLEDEDIRCIARTGTRLVHCPSSNLKLGNGIAPIVQLLRAGVVVGLGTDGGMCNDSYDMLREMALTALIHKGHWRDPRVLPAEQVVAMATCLGAEVLGLADTIGTLELGKRADITVLNMATIGWRPIHNPLANLVYGSATPACVDSVIVDGELLFCGGRPLHLDAEAIMRDAQERSAAVVEAAGLSRVVRSPWQRPGSAIRWIA